MKPEPKASVTSIASQPQTTQTVAPEAAPVETAEATEPVATAEATPASEPSPPVVDPCVSIKAELVAEKEARLVAAMADYNAEKQRIASMGLEDRHQAIYSRDNGHRYDRTVTQINNEYDPKIAALGC